MLRLSYGNDVDIFQAFRHECLDSTFLPRGYIQQLGCIHDLLGKEYTKFSTHSGYLWYQYYFHLNHEVSRLSSSRSTFSIHCVEPDKAG